MKGSVLGRRFTVFGAYYAVFKITSLPLYLLLRANQISQTFLTGLRITHESSIYHVFI